MNFEYIKKIADVLSDRLNGFIPSIALVLGSGFGDVINVIENPIEIPYGEIEGMPVSTAEGHKGSFVFGTLNGKAVAVMNGRVHLYEGYTPEQVVLPLRVLRVLGCKALILTNAAGGISYSLQPGDLMAITDHISAFVPNPLAGKNIDELGTRFPDMSAPYDKELTKQLEKTALKNGVALKKGTYVQLTGPSYESPAEIRMLRTLGADAVGMSTVCEAIAARHCGYRTAALSLITNYACGMTAEELNHKEVQETGKEMAKKISEILTEFAGEVN